MPHTSFKTNKSAPTVGNAGSKSLVAASAGNSIVVWQVIISGTAADSVILQDGSGGTTLVTVGTGVGATILNYTGAPWCQTTQGTALFFTAAATTTVTCYYTTP